MLLPIVYTLEATALELMVTVLRLVHCRKASLSMLVTLLGMVMDVKPLQE